MSYVSKEFCAGEFGVLDSQAAAQTRNSAGLTRPPAVPQPGAATPPAPKP